MNYWTNPVDVTLEGHSHQRTIASACYASECLLTLWPDCRGPAYFAALDACMDAMRGRKDQATARRAFISAAEEAHVLTVT